MQGIYIQGEASAVSFVRSLFLRQVLVRRAPHIRRCDRPQGVAHISHRQLTGSHGVCA